MCLWRPQGQAFWLNDTSDYTAALWRGSGKGRPFPASGFVAQGSVRRQLRAEMSNSEPAPWKVPCDDCPLRRKAVFRVFSESELEFVKEVKAGELNVETGTTVLLEGTNSAHLYTVLSGWAFRYKMLPDGRRQILNFALPGDLVGVQGSMFDKMEHSVEALNDLTCASFRERKSRHSSLGIQGLLSSGSVPSTVLTLLVLSRFDVNGTAMRDLITTVLSVALFVTAGL